MIINLQRDYHMELIIRFQIIKQMIVYWQDLLCHKVLQSFRWIKSAFIHVTMN